MYLTFKDSGNHSRKCFVFCILDMLFHQKSELLVVRRFPNKCCISHRASRPCQFGGVGLWSYNQPRRGAFFANKKPLNHIYFFFRKERWDDEGLKLETWLGEINEWWKIEMIVFILLNYYALQQRCGCWFVDTWSLKFEPNCRLWKKGTCVNNISRPGSKF